VFDIDPSLGSTATPGFTELAALYNTYRVLSYTSDVEVANGEAFAIQAVTIPWSNLQTAPTANDASTPELVSNQLSKKSILAAKGGQDRAKLRQHVNLARVYSKQALTDDQFSSKTNAGPGFVVYHVVGYTCAGTAVSTAAGMSAFIHYEINVMFYGRQVLTS